MQAAREQAAAILRNQPPYTDAMGNPIAAPPGQIDPSVRYPSRVRLIIAWHNNVSFYSWPSNKLKSSLQLQLQVKSKVMPLVYQQVKGKA